MRAAPRRGPVSYLVIGTPSLSTLSALEQVGDGTAGDGQLVVVNGLLRVLRTQLLHRVVGHFLRKQNKNDVMRLGKRPRSLEGKPNIKQFDTPIIVLVQFDGQNPSSFKYNSIHKTHNRFSTIRYTKPLIVLVQFDGPNP